MVIDPPPIPPGAYGGLTITEWYMIGMTGIMIIINPGKHGVFAREVAKRELRQAEEIAAALAGTPLPHQRVFTFTEVKTRVENVRR